MRKIILGLLVLGLLFAALPAEANNVELRILNETGYTWTELYVSPTTSDNWGNNLLSGTVTGDQMFVTNVRSGAAYDIMAVDTDGDCYVTRTSQIPTNYTWFRIEVRMEHIA